MTRPQEDLGLSCLNITFQSFRDFSGQTNGETFEIAREVFDNWTKENNVEALNVHTFRKYKLFHTDKVLHGLAARGLTKHSTILDKWSRQIKPHLPADLSNDAVVLQFLEKYK